MSLEFNLISSENYCTYITDGTHGTHSNQETGKYLLSAKDILDGNVHIKDNSRIISEDDFNKIHKNYKLENYDVLLTVAGTICRTAIIKNYQNNYTFQCSVAIFKTNDKIKSLWLYYYLNSPIGKQIIKSLSKGTTQLILPLKDLRNLEIPVPKNISDQKKILSILTDIDKKIEINKKINKNSSNMEFRKDSNPALFVSFKKPHNRLGINGVERRIRELGLEANIKKVYPHKFRRTMATNAIDKGMPIEQVQKLLGHVQIDTTMQYAMVNQSNVKIAHRKFIG